METEIIIDNSKWESIILGNAHNAVFLSDDQHRYVRANAGAVKLLGYSEEEFLGLSTQDITTEFLTMKKGSDSLNQLNLKNSLSGEVGMKKKDGTIIYCHYESITNYINGLRLSILIDISEKKKLKEIIEVEQLRFQKMFLEAPVSMCILKGKQLVFESANTNYYKFTGRTESIIGREVREVFPEVEGQGYFDFLDEVFITGETYSANESPLKLYLNGDSTLSNLFMNYMYQPFRDESGNVEGIFFFGIDVTEQVEARIKIEESEKRYKDLIENMPVAIYTTDAYGSINMFNSEAVKLWGRTPDVKTARFCGSLKILDLENNVIPPECCPMAVSLQTGKSINEIEGIVVRPDGEMRYVNPNTALIANKDGEITGAVNVMIDNTEKRKAEEEIKKLSLIAQKTDNGVIITNADDKIEWVNEGFIKNTGFSSEESIGKKVSDLLYGKLTNEASRKFITSKKKNQQAFECEILKYKKSGTPFWVEIKGQPIFDSKGKLIYYFVIESDITSRKEAFDRLLLAESQVRKFAGQLNNILEEERARIAREIHDEFGQQLSGLKMSLSYLKKISPDNQQVKELADSMKEDIDCTVQSLREFATELRPGILDSLGLTESLVWLVNEFEKKTNINCSFSKNLDGNEFDEVTSINIFRICQEALNNVLKHSNASNLSIAFNRDSKETVLTISDNGKGISCDNIINPFSMGLLGMKERAKLIKGELTVCGKKGTTVQLIINNNNV